MIALQSAEIYKLYLSNDISFFNLFLLKEPALIYISVCFSTNLKMKLIFVLTIHRKFYSQNMISLKGICENMDNFGNHIEAFIVATAM